MPPEPTVASVSQDVAVATAVQNEMKEDLKQVRDDIKEVRKKMDRPPIWSSLLLSASFGLNGALITALFTLHH